MSDKHRVLLWMSMLTQDSKIIYLNCAYKILLLRSYILAVFKFLVYKK